MKAQDSDQSGDAIHQPVQQQKKNFYTYLIISLFLSWLGALAVYWINRDQGLEQLQQESMRQISRQSDILENEIGRFGLLPMAASLNQNLAHYLANGAKPDARNDINQYLKQLNDRAGALQTYLINIDGQIVASSNSDKKDSFVGRNISYRPYFNQARPNKITTYYAIGTTGNTSGYFLATEVSEQQRRLGVVAVKIGLEQLEHLWRNAEEPLLLLDENQVIVLSSLPEWKYHTVGRLDKTIQTTLDHSQKYNHREIKPLAWRIIDTIDQHTRLIDIPKSHRPHEYLAVSQPLPGSSMNLIMLNDTQDIYGLAWARAIAMALIIGFASLLLHTFRLWKQYINAKLAARKALQHAHDRLEIKVEQRSSQLKAANEELRREIEEKIQAARQLQNFQQELIRTENLAVIGQLSAGIAHEINQPLAALSALSANAVRFLDINDLATVRFNLERITILVNKMGTLTNQLKSFARRSSSELEKVDISHCVENALFLLNHQLKNAKVKVNILARDKNIEAYCEPIRLEQVLVNLIGNAIDATNQHSQPEIAINWFCDQQQAIIQVLDNGIGLTDEVMSHIFEPFFTTKKVSGLGLGLALSSDIIKSFGGSIRAENNSTQGAVFTITLNLGKPEGV